MIIFGLLSSITSCAMVLLRVPSRKMERWIPLVRRLVEVLGRGEGWQRPVLFAHGDPLRI